MLVRPKSWVDGAPTRSKEVLEREVGTCKRLLAGPVPPKEYVWLHLAQMYGSLGRWAEAAVAYRTALERRSIVDPASGAPRTPDLGGRATTDDVGRAIVSAL